MVNLYRPPNGNVNEFLTTFQLQLLKLQDFLNAEIFISGDFNIDLNNMKDQNGKSLLNICKSYGLLQVIKKAKRYGKTRNSIIDLIFTNSKYIANSGVLNVNLSDHEMIYISKKNGKDPKIQTSFLGRSYRHYDKSIFQQSMGNLDWSDFFNSITPDEA